MAKMLIYMGRVGDKYRIALFDSDNPLARKLPVKDVPMLPTNVEYLNCSVTEDGIVMPNLDGVKPICGVSQKAYPNPDIQSGRDVPYFDLKKLWIDKKKEPKYWYGITEYGYDIKQMRANWICSVYLGYLLGSLSCWNIWDEQCTPETMYLIAGLAVRKSSKRFNIVSSILAMDYMGNLHLTNGNDMRICANAGVRYLQVGVPSKLRSTSVYSGSRLLTGSIPVLSIESPNEKRFIWHGQKKINEVDPVPVESVWWYKAWRTTICDFRKFVNAKAFGINSAADCSVVIYPESAEQIWLGFIQFCPSLKNVYIPPSATLIYDYGVPVRNVKKITIYSSSPAAITFCEKYGVKRIDCTNAEDMMEQFYAAAGGDYISVTDASNIASLAGANSSVAGEGGTVWSAALFSLHSKGIASEILQEKYPIVDLNQGKFKKPADVKLAVAGVQDGSCVPTNAIGEEVVRTFIGALTQFYPFTDKPMIVDEKKLEWVKYTLNDYSLYLGFHAFKKSQSGLKLLEAPDPNSWRRNTRDRFKKAVGDMTREAHIALLADPGGNVIHRFACPFTLTRVLKTVSAVVSIGAEPTGVLRYADKLPNIFRWFYAGEEKQVKDSLVQSFLVFSYHTAKLKRVMVGIDLHSGALATAEYTTHDYDTSIVSGTSSMRQRDIYFASVNRLSRVQMYPEDADLSELFPNECLYNKGRR